MYNSPSTKMRKQLIGYKSLFSRLLEQINQERKVTIRATGWSMLPLIWDDRDTITLGPLSDNSIKIGNIVLAQLGNGRYVVHRITKIKNSCIVLRGDGNPYQEEYVHQEKILAELVSINRAGKIIDRNSLSWKLCTLLWPNHGFTRRAILFIYRRLVVRPAPVRPRRLT